MVERGPPVGEQSLERTKKLLERETRRPSSGVTKVDGWIGRWRERVEDSELNKILLFIYIKTL